ncbi:hypothetical protein F5B18DRAFT_373667 [Nemania serpens]|nr:hypothetical protein F5B18DRAFT_373667 [Nemania serpens]
MAFTARTNRAPVVNSIPAPPAFCDSTFDQALVSLLSICSMFYFVKPFFLLLLSFSYLAYLLLFVFFSLSSFLSFFYHFVYKNKFAFFLEEDLPSYPCNERRGVSARRRSTNLM